MGVKSKIKQWANRQVAVMDRVEEVMAGVVLTRGIMTSPKDTGDLSNNGRVEMKDGHRTVKFGDEAVPYARIQELGGVTGRNYATTIVGQHYLKKSGDSVKKENPKKYVDMSL